MNFFTILLKRFPRLTLLSLISAAYLPFLNLRILRMAGDEKVYISQSIEMARAGNWFVQTLAGVPNYFKGPLHYLCIRVGMIFFGDQLLAATYMNWLFCLVIGLALFSIGKHLKIKNENALLLGLAGSLNVGVLSHAFASQMEVELCAAYCFSAAMLLTQRFSLFWLAAGIAGWIKSPLHSVLIGLGAISYWTLTAQLPSLLRSKRFLFSPLLGIATGVAGYLPAYLLDQKNFIEFFLGRENMGKPSNGRTWMYPTYSLPHFAWPWTLALLASLGISIKDAFKKTKEQRAILLFPILFSLPTLIFFCTFPYKGQNYNLPIIPVLMISIFSIERPLSSFLRPLLRPMGVLTLFATVILAMVVAKLSPWSTVFPEAWYALAVISGLTASGLLISAKNEATVALGCLLTVTTFLSWVTPPGIFELKDAQTWLETHPSTATVHYCDLEQTIWSEWGIMQLALHHPIQGLHRKEDLPQALGPGHILLVPGDEAMEALKSATTSLNQQTILSQANISTWRRWRTKGKDPQGNPLWKKAWQEKSLSPLMRNFYILSW